MKEISAQTGSDYDRMFVQRLREAHGGVLPLIAQVRVGTRNSLIREFATTADEFVSRHISYLESTGLVDYAALPQPPSPGLLSGATGWTDLAVPILVLVAALLAASALIAAMRRRSSPRRVVVGRSSNEPQPAAPPAIPGPRGAPEISGGYPAYVSQPGVARRRPAPSDVSGPYRRVDPAPGESTGPHRLPLTAPGETTGPRHAVRR
jgi:hypothetical protein